MKSEKLVTNDYASLTYLILQLYLFICEAVGKQDKRRLKNNQQQYRLRFSQCFGDRHDWQETQNFDYLIDCWFDHHNYRRCSFTPLALESPNKDQYSVYITEPQEITKPWQAQLTPDTYQKIAALIYELQSDILSRNSDIDTYQLREQIAHLLWITTENQQLRQEVEQLRVELDEHKEQEARLQAQNTARIKKVEPVCTEVEAYKEHAEENITQSGRPFIRYLQLSDSVHFREEILVETEADEIVRRISEIKEAQRQAKNTVQFALDVHEAFTVKELLEIVQKILDMATDEITKLVTHHKHVVRAAGATIEQLEEYFETEIKEAVSTIAEELLTSRPFEVLSLATQGLGNHQIASRLDISVSTVTQDFHHIYDKLGVHSRKEAISLACNDLLQYEDMGRGAGPEQPEGEARPTVESRIPKPEIQQAKKQWDATKTIDVVVEQDGVESKADVYIAPRHREADEDRPTSSFLEAMTGYVVFQAEAKHLRSVVEEVQENAERRREQVKQAEEIEITPKPTIERVKELRNEELTNPQIAETLGISPATVVKYVGQLIRSEEIASRSTHANTEVNRERVKELRTQGLKNSQIANKLGLSHDAVRTYASQLIKDGEISPRRRNRKQQ